MTASGPHVGVDGCGGGWLAVVWVGGALHARIARCWPELNVADGATVGVDMPIGLSDTGARACDVEARRALPPGRKSSVFPPPRRYMLGMSWAEANAEGKAREGVGLSKQAWHISAKIAELDTALSPEQQSRVFEVHPELVFHHLNRWRPLPPKRRAAGRELRRDLLLAAGVPDPAAILAGHGARGVKADDVLDAAACALAARRIATGRAARFPATPPPRDATGFRMEIWY